MKPALVATMKNNQAILAKLEEAGEKAADMPLGPKYLVTLPFKFGGKKRSPSNSGGTGRAGRRAKRAGKKR